MIAIILAFFPLYSVSSLLIPLRLIVLGGGYGKLSPLNKYITNTSAQPNMIYKESEWFLVHFRIAGVISFSLVEG